MKFLNLYCAVAFVLISLSLLGQEQARGFHPAPAQPNEETKAVKIFPNPAVEYVHVKFDVPQAKTSSFSIHNIIGNVLETETEVIDDFEVRVKVKDLSAGMYLLFIHNEHTGLKGAYKFIKK